MINVSKLYCGSPGQSDELRYEHTASTGPIVVYNCTPRCNLRCLHCYSASDCARRDAELDIAQSKKFLAGAVEINAPVVLFSGGEPLLRPDLFELLAEAKRLGLRTVISTNGTLIDEQTAAKLKDASLSYVGISLDGPEQIHDEFRQSKGAFKATLKGIRNCLNAGLRTGLRFTITKSNRLAVPLVYEIGAENKIRRICFYHLIRSGRATKLESEVLTPQQTRDVVDVIIQKTDEFARKGLVDEVLTVGNHADGPYLLVKMQKQGKSIDLPKRLLLANGGNRIGEGIVCVGWDGSVYPDQFWRSYSLGNVTQKSFREIWTNENEPVLKKLRNKDKFADKRCQKCKWFDLCKGNYRFLGSDPADKNWLLEPACYLTDEEIGLKAVA
jgi:radical SAM protein with 4Fe4S-binding SPASM domain